jgi:hypothetical protein
MSEEGVFKVAHVPNAGAGKASAQENEKLPEYQPPSLLDAQAFRLSTLPRRVKDPNQPTGYRLAKQGELVDAAGDPAVPYDLWSTPSDALDEFGVGISMYFATLKAFFVLFGIIAFISLTAMYGNKPSNNDDCPTVLQGSAEGATLDSLKFKRQGASDIACLIVLCAAMIVATRFEKAKIESIDEAQQTTQDYSIVINNPPVSITDPKHYYEHFSRFGEIVLITIAKNNGELIGKLAQKQVLQAKLAGLEQVDGRGVVVQKTPFLRLLDWIGLSPSSSKLLSDIAAIQNEIDMLASKDYFPWQVFVTFNTEAAQRKCLAESSTSDVAIISGVGVPDAAMLQGFPLRISEASEPSEIIYQNSHVSLLDRWLSFVLSGLISGGVIVLLFYAVKGIQLAPIHPAFIAIFIAAMNGILPNIIKMITQALEIHTDLTSVNLSILAKLIVGRCVVSAILFYIVVSESKQNTFTEESIQKILGILIADAVATPIMRICDLSSFVKRYILGPSLAVTQNELNVYWLGTPLTLAERYTDILKTFFVGYFFLVPLPQGMFVTAFAMLATYWVDKYSLFCIWRRQPMMDDSLAKFARYFMVVVLFAHVLVSRVYFANWPYDTDKYRHCNFFVCEIDR